MKKIFKLLVLTILISSAMSSCIKYDDFEFSGQVIYYTPCNSMSDMSDVGYFVEIESPKGIGGTITTTEGYKIENVVLIYQADKRIKDGYKISGRICMSDNYSKANCSIHQTQWKDIPEAIFTKVNIDRTPND